ncbi:3-deoxy-7-phosphoheptulonate synthase [Nocardia noduli]|uniref:3-deoxy-7-phosphoheptulonate synthase n=1 Tax=Nocardia noduli TaxID=2815722 RepID=UPI001C22CC9D|nr:3-deoxy-7-phosphoheptulonate synthase [Nocardia noduli]
MDIAALSNPPKAALHQPEWSDPGAIARVSTTLSERPGLVTADQVRALRGLLATVAAGRAHLIQAGDCAEDPAEATVEHVARKVGLLDILAGTMRMSTHKPILRIGRIAGQYAKPRSQPTEIVNGVELPTFRGHMVNGPEADPLARRFDPDRLLTGYDCARAITDWLGWNAERGRGPLDPPVWTSHEALLLDYELPMIRADEFGRPYLSSTHLPWVGARTGDPEGPHIKLLGQVANPVACKVGPAVNAEELLAIAERLDPDREPGRLLLIARMGHEVVAERLAPLVSAVRAAGHPVIWVCDPMHANTVRTQGGLKTRRVVDLATEIRGFQQAVRASGGVDGGLHLEVSPEDIIECADENGPEPEAGTRYTTGCDPRLNTAQAIAATAVWAPAASATWALEPVAATEVENHRA